jgi:hypothetical protein
VYKDEGIVQGNAPAKRLRTESPPQKAFDYRKPPASTGLSALKTTFDAKPWAGAHGWYEMGLWPARPN